MAKVSALKGSVQVFHSVQKTQLYVVGPLTLITYINAQTITLVLPGTGDLEN